MRTVRAVNIDDRARKLSFIEKYIRIALSYHSLEKNAKNDASYKKLSVESFLYVREEGKEKYLYDTNSGCIGGLPFQ